MNFENNTIPATETQEVVPPSPENQTVVKTPEEEAAQEEIMYKASISIENRKAGDAEKASALLAEIQGKPTIEEDRRTQQEIDLENEQEAKRLAYEKITIRRDILGIFPDRNKIISISDRSYRDGTRSPAERSQEAEKRDGISSPVDSIRALIALYKKQGEESGYSAASWDKYEKVIQETAQDLPDSILKKVILELANNKFNHALHALVLGPLTEKKVMEGAIKELERSPAFAEASTPGVLSPRVKELYADLQEKNGERARRVVEQRADALKEARSIISKVDENLEYNLHLDY